MVKGSDLSGTVLEDRYRVIEPISEGAMGVVYRGERLQLGRAVAIKVMHASLPGEMAGRQRFEREAKLMARLEHPHCVSVMDFGLYDDKPYLVMDLVRGVSLHELIVQHGRLDVPRAVDILRQVLSGLAHAHELEIIHRDIKPANIMVASKAALGDHVRILDFGLARLRESSKELTAGITVGTPSYMAPEQCRGGDLDGHTDLYACGVLLFELLSGRKPFVADDPIAVVRKHLNEPPPSLADALPGSDFGELEAVVARALAKVPADRFASAVEMSAAIDAALGSWKAVPRAPTPIPVSMDATQAIGSSALVPIGDSAAEAPVLGSSALVPIGEPSSGAATLAREPWFDDSQPARPASRPPPAARDHEASALRRMLPTSRMRYAVILGLVLAGGAIYGILVAKDRLREIATPDAAVAEVVVELDPAATRLVAAGNAHFAKLWWTDGIKEFREAIRIAPSLRSDPELIKTVVRGFITTPEYDPRLADFLVELGSPAVPYVDETARTHPRSEIRARAAMLLRRMH